MESKKINQLATELAPDLSDLTIIGDPTTGISKKITLSQMASLFTGTVEEYANFAAFPLVGVADTIYIAKDTNVLYRWNTGTNAYVELSPNIINSLVFSDANGFDGNISLVGSVATLTITTALTTGSVGFIGASGALLEDNTNFFWNNSTKRLGINTNAPTTALDVFGSGIIGRLNGTSTNNAFLGFSSAGTNKWSIGNVQSDHRFRIYNEATTSELVSVLSTGEFGIGIANPTTKFHIDGAASALIANLDANVSVAKSISFRSDNSNRINLEVSGTESGSNAGADLFIRRYSDAGALIDTPLTITRSTGIISLATALSGTSASFSSTLTASAFIPNGATIPTNGMYLSAANTLNFATNTTNRLFITSTGIVVIGGSAASRKLQVNTSGNDGIRIQTSGDNPTLDLMQTAAANAGARNWRIVTNWEGWGTFDIQSGTTNTEDPATTRVSISGITGNVGIGTGSPTAKLDVNGEIRMTGSTLFRGMSSNTLQLCGGTSSSNVKIDGSIEAITMDTNGVTRLSILSNGDIKSVGIYNNTTSNSANMYIFSDGSFSRSTSSIRFKTQIEDLTIDTTSILSKMRPIWYRSKTQNDRKDWSWYGFIAEELAEFEPRLVHWGYDLSQYETIEIEDEEGNIKKETKLKDGEQLIPDGVQYERITVLLVAELQKMRKELDALKAK